MNLLTSGLIVFGRREGDHVSISITDRNDAEGWLSGTLEVHVGAWGGACECWFHRGELRQFSSQIDRLYRDLTGTIEFSPMEPHLELRITGNGRGLMLAEGKAQDLVAQSTYLSFRLELDQTDLPAIAAALRGADHR